MENKYFTQLENALITIGRFSIVTAITTIARVLINISNETETKVELNGPIEGHIVALLTIILLVIIWFKFEIFITFVSEKRTLFLVILSTYLYIFLISGSAFFSIDSDFVKSDITSSALLSIGLFVLVLSDLFLLISDYRYVNYLKNHYPIKFDTAIIIYVARFFIPIFYFTYLLNSEYIKNGYNKYIHLGILIISIFFAIIMITNIFPKNNQRGELEIKSTMNSSQNS